MAGGSAAVDTFYRWCEMLRDDVASAHDVAYVLVTALAESSDAQHFHAAPESVRAALLEYLAGVREHGEAIVWLRGSPWMHDRTDEARSAIAVLVAAGSLPPGEMGLRLGMQFAGLEHALDGDSLAATIGPETRFLDVDLLGLERHRAEDPVHGIHRRGRSSDAMVLRLALRQLVRVYEDETRFAAHLRGRWNVTWRIEEPGVEMRSHIDWNQTRCRSLHVEPWQPHRRAPASFRVALRGDHVDVDLVGRRVVVQSIQALPLPRRLADADQGDA